jgi:fused signal recognition particle receptor
VNWGAVTYVGVPPLIQWKAYSGPGVVSFGNPAQTNTTATFSAPGVYTLMLSADDAVHAVAYDAVMITVTPTIPLTISRTGTNVDLSWNGGTPPYAVEQAGALSANAWSAVLTTNGQNAIQQAKLFTAAVEVTGLVLAKLDGTARGGAVFGIQSALGLPVRYIGTGEKLELLEPFDPEAFVDAILGG